MEIQVGEYVRTKDGYIGKVYNENLSSYLLDKIVNKEAEGCETIRDYCFWKDEIEKYNITKHSFNIVDLIEEGDYINGYKVLDIDFKNEMICLLMPFDEENKSKYNIVWNTKYFIKSIVTKEVFQNAEYRVETN